MDGMMLKAGWCRGRSPKPNNDVMGFAGEVLSVFYDCAARKQTEGLNPSYGYYGYTSLYFKSFPLITLSRLV